jgi:hypothetical protein
MCSKIRTGKNKKYDDPSIRPVIFDASPLNCKEQADHGDHEEDVSWDVQPEEALFPGKVAHICLVGMLQDEGNDDDRNGADRKTN